MRDEETTDNHYLGVIQLLQLLLQFLLNLLHFLRNSKPIIIFLLFIGIIVGLIFNRRVGISTFFLLNALSFIYSQYIVKEYSFSFSCVCGERIIKHILFLTPKKKESHFEDSEGRTIMECPSCERDIMEQWEKKGGDAFIEEAVEGAENRLVDSEMEKMSEAITKIGDPLLKRNPHMCKQVIAAAISAWNLSLQPKEEQLKEKKRVIERLHKKKYGTRKECQAAVNSLLSRKRRYYPHNKRAILSYRLRKIKGGQFHLIIMSEPYTQEAPIDSKE